MISQILRISRTNQPTRKNSMIRIKTYKFEFNFIEQGKKKCFIGKRVCGASAQTGTAERTS